MTNKKIHIKKNLTTYLLIAVLAITSLFAILTGTVFNKGVTSASALANENYWDKDWLDTPMYDLTFSSSINGEGKETIFKTCSIPSSAYSISFELMEINLFFRDPTGKQYVDSIIVDYFEDEYVFNIKLSDYVSIDISGLYEFYFSAVYGSSGHSQVAEISSINSVFISQTLPLPETPVKEGHTFKGWYFDEALTQPYDNSPIYADTALYAGFTINTYTLTFDTVGGAYVDTIKYNWNTTISSTDLPTPTKTGYNFKGWQYNGANFESVVITSNMTLVAVWEVIIYKVTFVVDGKPYKILEISYGTSLKEIAKEQKFSMFNVFKTADGKTLSKDTVITGESSFAVVEMTNVEKFMEFCKTYWAVPLIVGLLLTAGIIFLVIFIKRKVG